MGARSLLSAHEGGEELVISGHRQISPCCGHLPPPSTPSLPGEGFWGASAPPKAQRGLSSARRGMETLKVGGTETGEEKPTVFPRQLKKQITLEYYREGGKGKPPLPSGIGVNRATQGLSEKEKKS